MCPVDNPFRVRNTSGTRGSMGLGRHEVASAANGTNEPTFLKSWRQIASFLGPPLAVVQRWAKSEMPVIRQGRYMIASRERLGWKILSSLTASAKINDRDSRCKA